MIDWKTQAVNPDEAASCMTSGMRLFVHGAAATPTPLVAAQTARSVVEINEQMPRTHGNTLVPFSRIHACVHTDRPLAVQPASTASAVEDVTGEHVAALIPDRANAADGHRRHSRCGRDVNQRSLLWIRSLDSAPARPLTGTDGASFQSWSPDGTAVGTVQNLAPAEGGRAGTWNQQGIIVFVYYGFYGGQIVAADSFVVPTATCASCAEVCQTKTFLEAPRGAIRSLQHLRSHYAWIN